MEHRSADDRGAPAPRGHRIHERCEARLGRGNQDAAGRLGRGRRDGQCGPREWLIGVYGVRATAPRSYLARTRTVAWTNGCARRRRRRMTRAQDGTQRLGPDRHRRPADVLLQRRRCQRQRRRDDRRCDREGVGDPASSSTQFSAGAITFNITNDGDKEHEFVIRKTDLQSSALPLNSDGEVSEDAPELKQVGDPSEVAEIDPGTSEPHAHGDAPAGPLRHLLQPPCRGPAPLPEGHARRLHGQLTVTTPRIGRGGEPRPSGRAPVSSAAPPPRGGGRLARPVRRSACGPVAGVADPAGRSRRSEARDRELAPSCSSPSSRCRC